MTDRRAQYRPPVTGVRPFGIRYHVDVEVSALIVEDDSALGRLMHRTLTTRGYRVQRIASDYETAMQSLRKTLPSVLVADINLGGGRDGLELAHDVVEQFGELGVVIVTGKPTNDVVARAAALRFCTVLVKPVSRAQLVTAVELVASSSVDCERSDTRAIAALQAIEAVLQAGAPATVPTRPLLPELTQREQEVAGAVSRAGDIAVVATELGISTHTVKNHLKAAYRKLDVHSMAALVALARSRSKD